MATEAQIAANRRNAESSTGPRGEEGKSRSSRNAISFGLYSAGDFVRPDETHTYRDFCQSFRKELRPKGPLEQTLAAEIVHAAWRLRRCAVAESAMEPAAENEPDPLFSPAQAAIDRAQAQRQLLRATGELRRLQTELQVRVECLPKESVNAIGGLTSIKEIEISLKCPRQNEPNPSLPINAQSPAAGPAPAVPESNTSAVAAKTPQPCSSRPPDLPIL